MPPSKRLFRTCSLRQRRSSHTIQARMLTYAHVCSRTLTNAVECPAYAEATADAHAAQRPAALASTPRVPHVGTQQDLQQAATSTPRVPCTPKAATTVGSTPRAPFPLLRRGDWGLVQLLGPVIDAAMLQVCRTASFQEFFPPLSRLSSHAL